MPLTVQEGSTLLPKLIDTAMSFVASVETVKTGPATAVGVLKAFGVAEGTTLFKLGDLFDGISAAIKS